MNYTFPITSFLLSGVSYYKDTVKNVHVGDVLDMSFENNVYDNTAIIIKRGEDTCGYVPKDVKQKIQKYVPSIVTVIDKHYIGNDIYSLRVDIV